MAQPVVLQVNGMTGLSHSPGSPMPVPSKRKRDLHDEATNDISESKPDQQKTEESSLDATASLITEKQRQQTCRVVEAFFNAIKLYVALQSFNLANCCTPINTFCHELFLTLLAISPLCSLMSTIAPWMTPHYQTKH